MVTQLVILAVVVTGTSDWRSAGDLCGY